MNAIDVTTATAVSAMFNQIFESIDTLVEFDPKWSNNTGYLDYAVGASFPTPVKTLDAHDRRLVLIPSQHQGKSDVFFERYTGGGVICSHLPRANSISIGGRRVTPAMCGEVDDNLARLCEIYNQMTDIKV